MPTPQFLNEVVAKGAFLLKGTPHLFMLQAKSIEEAALYKRRA